MDGKRSDGWNPFENMPLELMMLVETRCDALTKYRSLGEAERAALDERARKTPGRREKEALIDAVERGDFG